MNDWQPADWISLVTLLATILGFWFIWKQIKIAKEQLEKQKKEVKITHAIDLAKQFQLLIEDEMDFINQSLGNQGNYSKVIGSIEDTQLSSFDIIEFDELCTTYPDLSTYKDYLTNYDIIITYLDSIAAAYLNTVEISPDEFHHINCFNHKKWKLSPEEEILFKQGPGENNPDYDSLANEVIILAYYSKKLINYFFSKSSSLLNKLEYLSMSLNSELAEEEIVYQSLHQSFLKIVKFMYPAICSQNKSSIADKYYSHIIERYVKWSERYKSEKDLEKKNRTLSTNKNSKY